MENLRNLTEDVVWRKLDQFLSGTNYCTCEKCRLDMATIALNELPPKYVNSLDKVILHKFESITPQSEVEVTTIVYKAIQTIGEHPNHD